MGHWCKRCEVCMLDVVDNVDTADWLMSMGHDGKLVWLGAVRVKDALKSAKTLIGSIAINELMERSDMILIVLFLSATNLEVVGAYAAAIPIASVMLIIPNAASLYVFNRAARPDEQPTLKELWTTIGLLVVLQVCLGQCSAFDSHFITLAVWCKIRRIDCICTSADSGCSSPRFIASR